MNSRRDLYDGLNANRPRRGPSALDDLERTLNGLEARVGSLGPKQESGSPRYRDDVAERLQQLNQQFSPRDARSGPVYGRSEQASAASLSRLAQDIERARHEEENFGGLSAVSAEISRLRADIRSLSDRPADRSGELLRREIEELKRNVSMLAREDTLRSVGTRWEAMERQPLDSDPAFEKLAGRLEEIQNAVDGLPQSLSLKSLEEKVRVLGTALDSLSRQNPNASAEHLELIESRLDEISRAIVASSVSIQPVNIDKTPFDRIEARLSALAGRIEEIAEGESGQALAEHVTSRIAALTERFDALAHSSTLPEEQISRLTAQMATIADKIADGPSGANPDAMMHGLENRLYEIASAIDKKSRDATDQTLSYFRDLEGRLKELTQRIEEAEQTPAQSGPDVMSLINDRFADIYTKIDEKQKKASDPVGLIAKGLETRLDAITKRLDTTAAAAPAFDSEIIRNLEAQVQNLSLQLDRPSAAQGDFVDISPRLAAIENSMTVNREALLDAARNAAEDAIRNMAMPQGSDIDREAVIDLANDLKALESMARKADDRNSRTFEAIHDTLLKIVDRLSTIETDGGSAIPALGELNERPAAPARTERSVSLGKDAPALQPDEVSFAEELPQPVRNVTRSPAQAAAAAAAAAEEKRVSAATEAGGKTSIFSGLARAVRGERTIAKAEGQLAGDPLMDRPQGETAEPVMANLPLEPGSGAPDLNSIMKRVREERQSRNDTGAVDGVVKSDLIAAARRAAQAAAAEAEILKKASGKTDAADKAGLSTLLSRQRKPILMAIGALTIALLGMQFSKVLFNRDADSDQASAPVAIEEKAAEAPLAAKVDEKAPSAEPAETIVREVGKPASGADALMAPKMTDAPATAEMQLSPDVMPAEPSASEMTAAAPEPAAQEPMAAAEAEKPAADAPMAAAAAPAEMPPVDAGPIALREAAAAGDTKAWFEIASRYSDGRGAAKDLKEAAKYYTKAADAGFAPAQFRIGSFYEKGMGVERDPAKAKTWYQMAAEQGNASAMHNLAVLFAMGAAGPADNDSAARWFVKAAELGVKDSQYNLGILAAKGLGVPQNLEDSYKWFALAAKAGDKDAAAKRDEIANAMRPEQLAKARAATDLWKAKTAEPAANSVDIPDAWKESAGQTASVGANVDMKKAIRNIQLILAKNGYDVGTPDGKMGGKTKKAIAAYQAANGMKATGDVDDELVRSLLAKAKAKS